MNDRGMLLALHETAGIGWKTIRRVVDHVPALTDLLQYRSSDFQRLGIRADKAEALTRISEQAILTLAQRYEHADVRIVTVLDAEYPELLRRISQPPWVIYARGNLELLSGFAVAIVGTRTPTIYGKKAAVDLARGLSERGFRIVSGLARGIDACAHLGALEGAGSTVAVLGSGLDVVYPADHIALFERIAAEGLLISEQPFATPFHPGLFPLRNRIIAGLSLGTVVVEAAERSGSLITADLALEESRDVFAVPGPIHSPKSRGTNALIRQGAKLTASAEDVAEEYDHLVSAQNKSTPGKLPSSPAWTGDEQKILSLLTPVPATFDRLLAETGMDFGHLHSVLLSLIVKRQIIPLPGSAYIALP